MARFTLKQGYDVPIAGDSNPEVVDGALATVASVRPADFIGIKPRLLVRDGDSVLAGTFLSLTADNAQALAEIMNCNEALMFFLVNSEGRTFYVAPTSPAVNTDMIDSTLTWMNGFNSGGLNTTTTNAFSIKFKMENLLYIEGADLSSFILDIDNP